MIEKHTTPSSAPVPRSPDRFLIGIVAGAILLVVAALVMIAMQPAPDYLPDTTPENIVKNYLLALQRSDYARAREYLSPSLKGYPASASDIADMATRNNYAYYGLSGASGATFTVSSAEPLNNSAGTVRVRVRVRQFNGGGLFGGSEHSSESYLDVTKVNETWKIANGDRWFAYCWTQTSGCR
ncbi:MAG: DUF4878 domain-containing protein [Chloroflexi bacterium]|nr:DUF4878 domain-containing protein [Chloroflexota bacterium]